jgi:hypothetical protein
VPRFADAWLRTWNASVPFWDSHKPGECTHWWVAVEGRRAGGLGACWACAALAPASKKQEAVGSHGGSCSLRNG